MLQHGIIISFLFYPVGASTQLYVRSLMRMPFAWEFYSVWIRFPARSTTICIEHFHKHFRSSLYSVKTCSLSVRYNSVFLVFLKIELTPVIIQIFFFSFAIAILLFFHFITGQVCCYTIQFYIHMCKPAQEVTLWDTLNNSWTWIKWYKKCINI